MHATALQPFRLGQRGVPVQVVLARRLVCKRRCSEDCFFGHTLASMTCPLDRRDTQSRGATAKMN